MGRANYGFLIVGGCALGLSSGCGDIGYVVTDPDPTYPPPGTNDTRPPDESTYDDPTTGDAWTTSGWNESTTESAVTSETSSTGEPAPTTGETTGDSETTSAIDTGIGTDGEAECGNGVVEGVEQCDDGNPDAGDGCEVDCTITPACGNGVIEGDEPCDDGNAIDGDGCESDCTLSSVCGNGVVEVGELCDDGNVIDGDGCSADCLDDSLPATCGDGLVVAPELCDDGNVEPGDGCEPDCTPTPATCGDGILEGSEQCDDGNVLDDDGCEGDCTLPPVCAAPVDYVVCDAGLDLNDKSDPTVVHRAFGICNDLPESSVQVSDFALSAVGGAGWQVAHGFGSFVFDHDDDPNTPNRPYYAPREGEALVILSTGTIAAPNPEGIVVEAANSQIANGDNGNDDGDVLPAPFEHFVGSHFGAGDWSFHECDGVHDCSDTLSADWQALPSIDDTVSLTFHATAPAGVSGFSFSMAFCSSEWPASLAEPENDLVIAWQSVPGDGYTGNVATLPDPFDPNLARPLTLSTLHSHFLDAGFVFFEPQLAGTGFEMHACSSWLTVRGGVELDAPVHLGFLLADRGDSERASVVLLDNFRWDCAGCEPEQVDECGVSATP